MVESACYDAALFCSAPDLRSLIDLAWEGFDSAREFHIVRPAVPILFFGDLAVYQHSDLRIITVGLNPSCAEFPRATESHDGLSRFPAARNLPKDGITSDADAAT